MGTLDGMVAAAAKDVGYVEPASAVTKFGVWYTAFKNVPNQGFESAEWCDMAISYWASASGNTGVVGAFAYVPFHMSWFQQRGIWHNGASGIRKGDVVIFNWDGGVPDHIGVVERVDTSGIHTIEGNTGRACKRMTRPTNVIQGYGRPGYSGTPNIGASIFGIDYSFSAPTPDQVKAGGARFVVRYLWETATSSGSKGLSLAERDALRARGISIAVVFETSVGRMRAGRAAGVADANRAEGLLGRVGMGGIPVYFACDENPNTFTAAQWSAIFAYLDGVISVIGLQRTGGYGGYEFIRRAFANGKITWGWQTYAWSTIGGVLKWEPRAQLQQYLNGQRMGIGTVDFNRTKAVDFGQWPRPKPSTATLVLGDIGPRVVLVQQRLNVHGANPLLTPDGDFGPLTKTEVIDFQRAHGIAGSGEVGAVTLAALMLAPDSTGAVKVPDLAGKNAGGAHNALVAMGLTPTGRAGQLATELTITLKPVPGTSVARGSSVEIISAVAKTIQRGALGTWVILAQRDLNKTGANLAVDGDFGAGTEAAVRSFQGSRAIGIDGVIGPTTWDRLGDI